MEFEFLDTYDDATKIPDQFKGLYADSNGSFALIKDDPKIGSAVAAALGLNNALKAARNENKTLKTSRVDLGPLKAYGETVEDIAARVTQEIATRDEAIAKNSKIDPEKIRADLAKAHAKDLEGRDGTISKLTQQLSAKLVDSEAIAAIAEMKGIPELLLPFMKQQIKVVPDAKGELTVSIVDQAGDVRYGVNGPLTIKELVAEMKGQEKFGRLFESEQQAGGGGKPPGSGGQRQPGQQTPLTANQKIALGLQKNQHSGR